jgi:hypothetical protein
MSDALVQRWDGFLKTITDRFQQIMQESRDGCAGLLADSDYDTIPMSNAWGAMERRAKELGTKVDETWRQQVEPKFDEAGVPKPIIDQQCAKGEQLRDWMEAEIERTGIQIFCDAAREIAKRVAAEKVEGFPCKQCGSPLAVPITFRTVNLTCPHCRTTNEYEPGTRVRMMEASCTHALCQESAWNEWLAMRNAENAWRRARPHTIEHLKAWEAAQIAYHRAYLTKRLQFLPDQAPSFDKDLKGRMEHFYAYTVNNDGVWIKAGRPRAAL